MYVVRFSGNEVFKFNHLADAIQFIDTAMECGTIQDGSYEKPLRIVFTQEDEDE